MNKKIILSLIILIIIILLIVEIFIMGQKEDKVENSFQGGASVYQSTIMNDQGEYDLTNSIYAVGEDIPSGTYKIKSKTTGTYIKIITAEETKDVSSLSQGDKITLDETDTAIVVSDGELLLQ